MDALIRQFTELGVTRFSPFISERSIPRPDKKRLQSRLHRWETITRESLKQCGRRHLMDINEVVSFKSILDHANKSDLKIIFWEHAEQTNQTILNRDDKHMIKKVFAVLGPEGGFTLDEVSAAKSAGFLTASLGPRILKAETAAVAASVLMQYLFGDMG
jgi:16S rRNA (uracil1498-N3)-methyltransferase